MKYLKFSLQKLASFTFSLAMGIVVKGKLIKNETQHNDEKLMNE